MPRPKPRRLKWILLAVLLILGGIGFRFVFAHPGFNPDKVAHAETEMWRGYYAGKKNKVAIELVLLLRRQHGLSLPDATRIGNLYAQAAMKFAGAQGDYNSLVLPDLVQAYTLLKETSKAAYDVDAVAKAELAWWVARRTPGQDSAEQVGQKITRLYVLLYGRNDPSLQSSGLLRAQAAALRDAGGRNPDWAQVEALLQQSYRALGEGALKR